MSEIWIKLRVTAEFSFSISALFALCCSFIFCLKSITDIKLNPKSNATIIAKTPITIETQSIVNGVHLKYAINKAATAITKENTFKYFIPPSEFCITPAYVLLSSCAPSIDGRSRFRPCLDSDFADE